MGVDVRTEATIEMPRDAVASYAADPSNAPEWYANISTARWLTDPPVCVGARITFVASFLGRRLEYTYEVVDYEPGVRLVMRTAEGPFPMETSYTWDSESSESTRMTLRNRGTPSGFAAITAPLMARAMRRANTRDLERLKSILESNRSS